MEAKHHTLAEQKMIKRSDILAFIQAYLCDIKAKNPFNAVMHPNGYLKCVLRSAADGSRLRLHIWNGLSGGYRDPAIHNHCWDFSSQVLAGTLKEEIYCRTQGEIKERTWNHYRFSRNEDARDLQNLGNAQLSLIETTIHQTNSTYHRHHDTIHLVTALDPFTATLVHEGPTLRASNDVFMHEEIKPLTTIKLEYTSEPPKILIDALEELTLRLEQQDY